jgi:hypothetical protein
MRHAILSLAIACGPAVAAEATLYKDPGFRGDSLGVRNAVHDLSRANFHDQISSIVVESGNWEVCTQPGFRGDCEVLGPGRYASLPGRINHRIESVREAPPYVLSGQRAAGAPPGKPDAALVLFSGERFMGTAYAVSKDSGTLVERGLSTPPGSLIVHEGTWQACAQPGHQGLCRVFRPGRYDDLSSMGAAIASLRRLGKDD